MDEDIYVFRIDAFTPDTIPMARLADYLAGLATIFGERERVHFKGLEPGSTKVFSVVEREAAPKVRDHLQALAANDAGPQSADAFKKLNELLRKDNASATLTRGTAEVLKFPGRWMNRPPKIGPFSQSVVRDGVLVRIGGKDKTAHASIEDQAGRTWIFEVSRERAKELALHLFGKPIRVIGQGRWTRSEEGIWEYTSLKAIDFEVLKETDLRSIVGSIRQRVKGSLSAGAADNLRAIRDDEETD